MMHDANEARPPMTEPSESQSEPDAQLIVRIRSGGDAQAYGNLVQRYERGALAAVLPILRGDLHAAQDVVQDVFVHCYLKLHTLRDASRFGSWLMKSARREAVRAQRRRTRTPVTPAASEIGVEPQI